ncbi:MAG TPA: hypothetical protein PKI14_03960 [Fervidobacterium sp.]|mgnify:CR=1 FL=1|nr:hypothetical protein [Fervidobacterium sp.]HPP17915.1 hypothetical protein [Fervidobacterium sp.]HPZ17304.1 hypothetical protein [Fervidobacterium sp.]HQE48375.1 hypothetical protein [Fervidobacterium sp.]HRD19713.1 hypothetical protein [Fervidobacterium sp.]
MMQEYIKALKGIFDPVALFIKNGEFILVVKDEININERISQLYKNEDIDDDMSLIILSKEEFEKMDKDELGEKLL